MRLECPPSDGVWLSLVERSVRDAEVGSSNLPTPTIQLSCLPGSIGLARAEVAKCEIVCAMPGPRMPALRERGEYSKAARSTPRPG